MDRSMNHRVLMGLELVKKQPKTGQQPVICIPWCIPKNSIFVKATEAKAFTDKFKRRCTIQEGVSES